MSMNAPPEPTFEDERLTAYLDGELSDAELTQLEAELDQSPSLREELDTLRSVQTFMGEQLPLSAPPDLLDDILALVAEEKVVPLAWYRRPFGIPLEGIAVAAAAMLVIYVALPSRSVQSEPTEIASGRAAPMKAEGKVTRTSAPTKADDDGVAVVDRAEKPATDTRADEKVLWEQKAKEKGQKARSKDQRAKGIGDFSLPTNKETGTEAAPKLAPSTDKPTANPASKGADSTLFTQVPYSYSISTTDPAVLAQLAALAARYRGELKGSGETPLEITELSGTDAATVMVKIPSHALRDFGRSLSALGVVQATADNSMFAGDPVEVRVNVQLVQATGIAEPQKPSNSPKKLSAPKK